VPDAGPEQRASTHVRLKLGEDSIEFDASITTAPVEDAAVVPLARSLTDAVVDLASDAALREGRTVSCRAGCGACCRQLVPISAVEARGLAALVEAMPEPRRTQVRERFAAARARLDRAGLLARVEAPPADLAERRELGLAYFRLGLACPFLVDESCSIHAERPLACREYLVTSPAANCAQPSADTVRMVPLSMKVSSALRRVGGAVPGGYVPLVLALSWAAAHPAPGQRPGVDVLREFLGALSDAAERG
jgi:Fe-S-cluster containining protein